MGEIGKVTEEIGQRVMTGEEEHGVLEGELGLTGVCDVPLLLVPSQNVNQFYIPTHALWHRVCFWRGRCKNGGGGKQSIPIEFITLGSHLYPS